MQIIQTEKLNRSLSPILVDARLAHILNTYKEEVLITSSFGITSALLLHILSRVRPGFPVHFVDTGYLFKETIAYKEQLTGLLGLNVITLRPDIEKHRKSEETNLWVSDPDLCCQYNKVEPLEMVKTDHKVWVSGLLGFQSRYRSGLNIVQQKRKTYRFYPLIDWTPKMVYEYYEQFQIPRHPLEKMGFSSVGCSHCTRRGDDREGRWKGLSKTECGLHL